MKNITSVAMDVANKSTTLLKDNKALVEKYHANEKEARELMRKGQKEYKMANDTFEKAQAAHKKARKAKEAADNTAKDALEVLRLLTVSFTDNIILSAKVYLI